MFWVVDTVFNSWYSQLH